jgi:hypothetical protein
MFNPLGVEFRILLGNANGAQKIDDEPVAGADSIRKTTSLGGQENAAIELRGHKPFAFEAADGFDRGCMRHAQPAGYVGRARLAAACQEIVDQFDVIFKDSRRLRRTRFFKALGLDHFTGQLNGRLALAGRLKLSRFLYHKTFVSWPGITLTLSIPNSNKKASSQLFLRLIIM